MKTEFIPTNASLRTGMLAVCEKGNKVILLLDNFGGKYDIGRAAGETWFPIYKDDECFKKNEYFHEIWSTNPSNREALSLSTSGRALLWKKEPDIMIDDDIVEFREDAIKVGCTTVSHEKVKEIYNRIFNKEEK